MDHTIHADGAVAGKANVRVITGQRGLFVTLYMLLCFLFSLLVVLSALAAVVLGGLVLLGKAELSGISGLIPRILAFDFRSLGFSGAGEAAQQIIAAACCLVFVSAGTVLAVILGLLIRVHKRRGAPRRDLAPLLPGWKLGYIPCDEGIYKLLYWNIMTGTKLFGYYPWRELSIRRIDEKRKRLFLKRRSMLLCLEGKAAGGTDRFQDLKSIVLSRLPEAGRVLPLKGDHFKAWLAAVLAIALVFLGAMAARGYEHVSGHPLNTTLCDISGKLHLTPEPTAFSTYGGKVYVYQVYQGQSLQHRYCLLHGGVYITLHPVVGVRSLLVTAAGPGLRTMFPDALSLLFLLVFPLYWWAFAIIIIIQGARPQVMRFHSL